MISYLKVLFFGNGFFVGHELGFYLQNYGVVLLIAVFASIPIARWWKEKVVQLQGVAKTLVYSITCVVYFVLFLITVSYLVADTYNPFLYFRF